MSTKTRTGVASDVLSFLENHRLDPTPDNYRLAYIHLVGSDDAVSRAIREATDGGIRLHPDDVARILLITGQGADPVASRSADDESRSEMRRQAMEIADLVTDAAGATEEFGRDLASGIADLDRDPSGEAVRKALALMADRAKAAESRLAKAAGDIQTLRQDLDAARNDATKDALTGLCNRRAMDDSIAKLTGPASFVVVDIDHFKSVNDRFGHAVGDRVLKAVGETLARECAPHQVCRWGGEEFVVVLRDVQPAHAAAIVDKAREVLSTRSFKLRDTDEPLGRITFSAGVSAARADYPAAIARADELLYEAKRAGRNKVSFSPAIL